MVLKALKVNTVGKVQINHLNTKEVEVVVVKLDLQLFKRKGSKKFTAIPFSMSTQTKRIHLKCYQLQQHLVCKQHRKL